MAQRFQRWAKVTRFEFIHGAQGLSLVRALLPANALWEIIRRLRGRPGGIPDLRPIPQAATSSSSASTASGSMLLLSSATGGA